MTALVIAVCCALYAGYRWGRYSRLREFVTICGGDQLAHRELVTMLEVTRHRNLVGRGDRHLQEFLTELDVCWCTYALADPDTLTEGAQRGRQALLDVAELTGHELGGWV